MTASEPITLRQAQREEIHNRIFRALSELVVSDGLEHVSFPPLTRRAGIGVATLYRHFSTKQALFDAFFVWLDREGHTDRAPSSPDDLLALLPELYAFFDENESVIRAGLVTGTGRQHRAANRKRRWETEWRDVEKGLAPDDAEGAARLGAVLRLLVNSQAWLTLRDECGMRGEEAGRVAAWLFALAINDVRKS